MKRWLAALALVELARAASQRFIRSREPTENLSNTS
jgi:hypothetical protein